MTRLRTAASVLLPLLALVFAAPARAQNACARSTAATDCDDGEPCTDDFCDDGGRCVSLPASGEPCDDGDPCTRDDLCDEGACTGAPVVCNDGVACTDDFCDGGLCVAEPVDSLCPEAPECALPRCSPGAPGASEAGCVLEGGGFETSECTPDEDPCTVDRCRTAACAHDPVVDLSGCAPLRPSYRRALALRGGVERVLAFASDEAGVGGDPGSVILEQLAGLLNDLDASVRVLGGLEAGLPLPTGAGRGLRLPANPSTAQLRGRLAFPWLRGAPARAGRFLRAVSAGRRRDEVGGDAARELRRNGRILLAETKALKRDVRNLQRTFSVFQR